MKKIFIAVFALLVSVFFGGPAFPRGAASSQMTADDVRGSMPGLLNLREQTGIVNRRLEKRLDTILPEIMRRENIDMWIVISREYNEDPVVSSLLPRDFLSIRGLTILVFFDRGEKGVERLSASRFGYGLGGLYKWMLTPENNDPWQCLAAIVKERNPRNIGINESAVFAHGDGLSSALKETFVRTLGPGIAARLRSGEKIAMGLLEKRLPEELEVYPQVVAVGRRIIAEGLSGRAIIPGVTTTEDLSWWLRERARELGLDVWFQPYATVTKRSGGGSGDNVLRRGDLVHCDFGIKYLNLCSDNQEYAYILKEGEADCPKGIQDVLALGNRVQDILFCEFREGRTGNEILAAALEKMKTEGLNATIASHPLGIHGHGAGPAIGMWDRQAGIPGEGDYPLFADTCYALEFNVRAEVPEWGGQKIGLTLEQDIVFTKDGVRFLDGRQDKIHLIL